MAKKDEVGQKCHSFDAKSDKLGSAGSAGRAKSVQKGLSEKKKSAKRVDLKKVELGSVGRHSNNKNNNFISTYATCATQYELLFERQKLKISPSIGVIHNKYYFGTVVSCRFPVQDKQGNQVFNVAEKTVLIMPNNKFIVKDELRDIECVDMVSNNRWNKNYVKSYLDCTDVAEDERVVLDKVKAMYDDHIDFSNDGDYLFMTLWDIGTYFFPIFNSYPYIHLHGFKNSGKTKVMAVSSNISFNGILGGCMRPATMFRLIEANRPTLYLDEFEIIDERKRSRDDEDIYLMLNMGYKKGNVVYRNEQVGKKWVPTPFEVYCPKVIANISGIVGALSSRCIKIVLLRAKANDKRANKAIEENDYVWSDIRNQLYLLALDKWKEVKVNYDMIANPDGINNRDWELWKPLLALSKFFSKETYDAMLAYAKDKINERNIEEQTSNTWEDHLLDVLESNVTEHRYYGIKKELTYWLHQAYFLSDDGQSYVKAKPTERWVSSTLRCLPVINFRKVKGLTEVALSPEIVLKLVSRLRTKAEFSDAKTHIEAIDEEMVE